MAMTGTFGGFNFDAEVFTGYTNEPDPINSLLIDSQVFRPASKEISSSLNEKSTVTTIPYYTAFAGEALNDDGGTDNNPVTTSGKKMSVMGYLRMKAWKEQDFTIEVTHSNDLANVARSIGKYQAKCNQSSALSILSAIEGVSEFSSHVTNIAVTTADTDVTTSNKLTTEVAMDAMQKALGDHKDEFKVWFMHSSVANDLAKQGLANDVTIKYKAMTGSPIIHEFAGLPIIEDDTMTVTLNATTGKLEYHTYLMGTGAFITCPIARKTPNYVDYDPITTGGVEMLFNKWGRLIHPYGFSFKASNIAKESPTDAQLGTSANWEMSYESKNIPIASFITNVR